MSRTELENMTVKALNILARDRKMVRYSALRKAALIDYILADMACEQADTLDIETMLAEVISEAAQESTPVAPLTFSHSTPVKAPESHAEPPKTVTPSETTTTDEAPSLEDLKSAYRNMRRTVNAMGARGAEGERRVRYVGKLRALSAQLKSAGIKAPQYL